MIGPLLAIAAATVLGAPTAASAGLRNAGQWLIGTAMGLYFTPQVLGTVAKLAPAIVLGLVWALALGYGFYRWLAWANRGQGVLPATAFYAAAIGGASEMANMADRQGAQVDRVAGAHSLRVLIVVLLIPLGLQWLGVHGADQASLASHAVQPGGLALLLAATATGGFVLRWLGSPNPFVLGALGVAAGLTAAGVDWSALPKPLTSAAQVALAATLAVRFSPASVRAAPRWLGAVAVGTLAMIVLSAGFAAALAWACGLHPATLLLATSPGGIAEMAITASVLGLGVPVVTAFHVLRYVAVMVGVGAIWGWEARRLSRGNRPRD